MSEKSAVEAHPATVQTRKDNEAPSAIAVEVWRYHHIGIPTTISRPGERYLPRLKMFVSGFELSPCGIQWMRFDSDAPYPEIVKTLPHVAFEVDDLKSALEGKEILIPPNSPGEGVIVAMILDNGAPIELMEFIPPLKPRYDWREARSSGKSCWHPCYGYMVGKQEITRFLGCFPVDSPAAAQGRSDRTAIITMATREATKANSQK